MKNIWLKFCGYALVSAMAAAGFGLLTGCESNSDDSGVDDYFKSNAYQSEDRLEPDPTELQVSPALGTISIVGGEVLFTGKGGTPPYKWSLTDTGKGALSVEGWSQCRYICLQVGNNTIRMEDDDGHFAVARITPAQDSMTVHPSEVTAVLSASSIAKASFTVQGGSPPYVWSVGNPALGMISYSAATSYQSAYTGVRGAYGVNLVTVRDADGRTAYATVTQTAEE